MFFQTMDCPNLTLEVTGPNRYLLLTSFATTWTVDRVFADTACACTAGATRVPKLPSTSATKNMSVDGRHKARIILSS